MSRSDFAKLPKSARVDRRRFLAAAGTTAATLPFLRALPSYAQADAVPKLILGFSGNGRVRHLWGGDDSTGQMVLAPNLAPLQPFAESVTLVDGMYNLGGEQIGGTHEGGTKALFTGAGAGVDPESNGVGGPSMDTVFMAGQVGSAKDTSFYQQVVAERNSAEAAGPNNRISFDNTGAAREPYRSSWEAVDGYLADVIGPAGANPQEQGPGPADVARTKLFESLNAQLGELESQLCAEDYYQMGAMREAVDRASNSMQAVLQCELPQLPAKPTNLQPWEPVWIPPQRAIDLSSNSDWYFLRARLSIDLLVVALACGVTRSAVLQFDQGAGEAMAVGHPMTHHNQSHANPTGITQTAIVHHYVSEADPHYFIDSRHDPPANVRQQFEDSWKLLTEWELYYANHMAYLLGQLEAFGLLSDTALLWGSEVDNGGAHDHLNMPTLLVSGDKLPFARGKVLRYPHAFGSGVEDMRSAIAPPGTPRHHNDLLTTVLTGLGVPTDTIGPAALNGGPLTELLVG